MPILQSSLPYTPWSDPRMMRLPGIQPLDPSDWIMVDDAYADQMAERDRLFADARDKVLALDESARPAAEELLEVLLDHLGDRPDFEVGRHQVVRPDGVTVPLDRASPLLTAGRLVQEDLCLMERREVDEHLLSGAALCFPAGWTLSEKFMRPMMRIHVPVVQYDEDVGKRVQRLLDGIQPGRPLWRANVHYYDDPALFAPQRENSPRTKREGRGSYIRSERQCLLRLETTRAVVFSIHTFMVRTDSLTEAQTRALAENPIGYEAVRILP